MEWWVFQASTWCNGIHCNNYKQCKHCKHLTILGVGQFGQQGIGSMPTLNGQLYQQGQG